MSIPSAIRDAPKTFRLSVRIKPDSGGQVRPAVEDIDNLLGSGFRHVLILVHGFNNSAQDARDSYKKQKQLLEAELKRSRIAPDAIAEFQWPGDEEVFGPNALGYATDIERARDSAQRLATFLARLAALRDGAQPVKVTLVGHSLGCRLIVEALSAIPAASLPSLEVVSLMAAALPVDLVTNGQRLFPTHRLPRRLLKFFSEADTVLQHAFPLGQRWASIRGIEPAFYAEAVGRFGNPREFATGFHRRSNKHGDYWGDAGAALILLETIDPTLRQLLAGAPLAERSLPRASEIAARSLPTRPGPGSSTDADPTGVV
jgi:esterase/lipase superfamily enzyme